MRCVFSQLPARGRRGARLPVLQVARVLLQLVAPHHVRRARVRRPVLAEVAATVEQGELDDIVLELSASEGVRPAQTVHVGPCVPVGVRLYTAEAFAQPPGRRGVLPDPPSPAAASAPLRARSVAAQRGRTAAWAGLAKGRRRHLLDQTWLQWPRDCGARGKLLKQVSSEPE